MTNTRDELIKVLKKVMPCTCLDAYKIRNLADPECSWCGYGEDIVDYILKDRKKIITEYEKELHILHLTTVSVDWHRKEVEKIVEPLVKCKSWYAENSSGMEWRNIASCFLVFQKDTLKNAGLNQ